MNRTFHLPPALARWRVMLMLLVMLAPAGLAQGRVVQQPTTQPADAAVAFERWYVVNMAGQHAGYLHAQELVEDGNLVDRTRMKLEIRRGQIALLIEMQTSFTETPQGKPIEAVNMQKISRMATTTTMRFEPEKIVIITQQGQQRSERGALYGTQPWMTPAALARHIEKELAAGSKVIKTWSIEPSLGPDPFETTLKVTGSQVIPIMGRRVQATVLESSTSRMPGVVSKIYADEKGRPIKMNLGMGGIDLEVIQADKAVALTPVNPPQLLAEMLITPKGKIDSPRTHRQGIYELKIGRMEDGAAVPLPEAFLPRGAYQRVVWSDESTVRVVVDLDNPVEPGKDLPTPADKAASPMLDIHDPQVKRLAQLAVKDVPADATPAVKAEAVRRFVHQYIDRKDLSVGFASAGEVARNAQGDCTEHAVLLAALLRCHGLASRTASGLVYADNFEGHERIFGYHMWTRVWLPGEKGKAGQWVDLDATLSQTEPFDATHIALGVGDMSQGVMANDMLLLAPVLGRLGIEVVK